MGAIEIGLISMMGAHTTPSSPVRERENERGRERGRERKRGRGRERKKRERCRIWLLN
jgi:hypothetical protein